MTTLLITGASGQLGRKAIADLLARGVAPSSIIATTRSPEHLADLAGRGVQVRQASFDTADLVPAFRGAERALLISTDALERPGHRIAQQRRAVAALEAAGVEHVVYTSGPNPHPGSPVGIMADHRLTEAALADSRLGWTILRNNLYIDLLLGVLPGAIASGQLVDARGGQAAGLVTRDDAARAAAGALVRDTPNELRTTLEVTGPELVTSRQVAAIASALSGKPVAAVSVSPEALVEGLVAHGVPAVYARIYAELDTAVARGELALVTTAVELLSGRQPESVGEFLKASLKV